MAKGFSRIATPIYIDSATNEPTMNVAGSINISDSSGTIVDSFGGLLKVKQGDAIVYSEPTTSSEVYTVKTGGVSGTTVCVITVVYTSITKSVLQSISSVIS